MKRWVLMGICGLLVGAGYGGGELPDGAQVPARQPRAVAHKRIGPPAGDQSVCREAPLPAPKRGIGWGRQLHEFYGPSYYYPSERQYESLNPSHYPFFHPRLWPNYKAEASYPRGHYCGTSRSNWYWDEYDDWVRGGRYEEHQ